MSGLTQFAAMVYAHAGGRNEILLVGAPVAVFGFLLLVAKRRAEAVAAARNVGRESPDEG